MYSSSFDKFYVITVAVATASTKNNNDQLPPIISH